MKRDSRSNCQICFPSIKIDLEGILTLLASLAEPRAKRQVLGYQLYYEREAADSKPRSGDRRAYQMDAPNAREALREMAADLAEGADVLMVKPALPYLDVLRRARERFDVPLAAYQVSGEYSMIVAAAERGWIDRRSAVIESLTAIARAGADIVITYFAR